MKTEWAVEPLGRLAEVIPGQSPKGANCNTKGKGTPFFQGKKDFGDRYIGEPTAWTTQVTRLAKANDVLMSVRAPVGPVNLASQDLCIGRGLAAIRPSAAIDTDFLFYCLQSKQHEIKGSEGAVFASINRQQIEAIAIPVPPLPEQRRIVAILDEAFEGIAAAKANTERNLRNAREVFEGWRQALFQEDGQTSSGQCRLGDIVNVQNGFAFKSGDYCDAGHFVVRIGNVQDGELVLENPRFIELTDPKQDRFVLNAGDILVSLTGNIGRAAMVEAHHLPAVLNQRVARITTKTDTVSKDWVFAFLTSHSFRQRLQTAGHGAAQQNVSTKEIEAVPVCLPSRNEQERQITQVLAMRSSVTDWNESYTRRLAALDELKASLLHQAFTGQL